MGLRGALNGAGEWDGYITFLHSTFNGNKPAWGGTMWASSPTMKPVPCTIHPTGTAFYLSPPLISQPTADSFPPGGSQGVVIWGWCRLTGDTPSVKNRRFLTASPEGTPRRLPPALRGVKRKRGQGVCPALNGTRFDMNVGDDAHIVPKPYGIARCVEWGGKKDVYITFPHSTGHGNIPPRGGTMWASSPTLKPVPCTIHPTGFV